MNNTPRLVGIVPTNMGRNVSGTITLLEVSRGSIIVGQGFILWDWLTDLQSNPILSTLSGKPLPTGQFDITVTEERLALISFNIH